MRSNRLMMLGLVLPLLSAMAACGGGGGSGDGGAGGGNSGNAGGGTGGGAVGAQSFPFSVELPDGAEFSSLPQPAQALVTEFRGRNQGFPTDATTLMGSATYSGAVGLVVESGQQGQTEAALTGDIGLTANFDSDVVTGVLNNFAVTSTNYTGPVGGDLTFSNGVVTASSFRAENGLGGTLTTPDNEAYNVSGTIDGAFLQDSGSQVIGVVNGQITGDGETNDLGGIFSADKN